MIMERAMNVIVGSSYVADHHSSENESFIHRWNHTNILKNTCFADYETLACVRSTILFFLTVVTGMLCTARVVSLHVSDHPNYYQYAIFYLAIIQCIVQAVEWVVGWTVHASLAGLYLRSLELLVICHFYLTLACRATRQSNGLANRMSTAVLSMFLMYFTSFIIIGFVFSGVPAHDCFANYWLFLSGGQLALIQFLATAAFLIVHRVNAVRTQESFKRAQKRGVWTLILTFETSAIVCIVYHVTVWALATKDEGCSGVFLHKQAIYSPVRIAHEILTSLLPLWVMLHVFKPVHQHGHNQRLSTEPTDDVESFGSNDRRRLISNSGRRHDTVVVDPSIVPGPSMRDWIRRRQSSAQLSPVSARTLLPNSIQYPRVVPVRTIVGKPRRFRTYGGKRISNGGIRRTSSAPSALRHKRTPPLAPIPEESSNISQPSSSAASPRNSPPKPHSIDYVLQGNVGFEDAASPEPGTSAFSTD